MRNSSDDLEALIGELNAEREPSARETVDHTSFHGWILDVIRRKGSDLLLVTGGPPVARVDGTLTPLDNSNLDDRDVEAAIIPLLPAHAVKQYRARGIADASLRLSEIGRFRINLHREKGHPAACIRVFPNRVPHLSELNLPVEFERLATLNSGLVLIGGATGSGKTTTMAALVDAINHSKSKHIVTVEDPIEYEHVSRLGVVEQVEIGVDAPDFPTALRAAMRQAPDILVIGEMRDPESMRIAVSAAETGHLLFSSLHTTDIASTVARICDSFPNERQNTIRQELSLALSAVATQALLSKEGGGRVPAAELLLVGYGARQHIRRNALQHLHQEITITRKNGSSALEDSLARLVKEGAILKAEALAHARHPEELEGLLR